MDEKQGAGRMSGWPQGYGLHVLDEVDSTLSEAARIAPQAAGPVWIMARRQTAARGRRGRAWSAPEGNLSATLLMRPGGDPSQAALRSFVSALALFDAVAAVTGRTEGLSLKWPNDVLLNGGKLAGILLESSGAAGAGVAALAIGIGVNLVAAPPVAAVETRALRPVSLAGETGLTVTPEDFLEALAKAYDEHERAFLAYGFGPIRTAWLARAARLGEVITARLTNEEITGTFETVDSEGNLVLVLAGGTKRHIPAADIFF